MLINKAREVIGKEARAAKYADELERLRRAREAAEVAKKFAGAKGLIGKAYENFLNKVLKGEGSFSVQGREFDGKYDLGKKWYEAKSGRYWVDHASKPEDIAKFKSDMGHRLSIATSNGAKYELYSNTLIPDNIKSWLTQKGIKFIETLN